MLCVHAYSKQTTCTHLSLPVHAHAVLMTLKTIQSCAEAYQVGPETSTDQHYCRVPQCTAPPIPPVAHTVFGVPQTINSANYVYFLALERTLALSHPEGVRIFACRLREVHHMPHHMYTCRSADVLVQVSCWSCIVGRVRRYTGGTVSSAPRRRSTWT